MYEFTPNLQHQYAVCMQFVYRLGQTAYANVQFHPNCIQFGWNCILAYAVWLKVYVNCIKCAYVCVSCFVVKLNEVFGKSAFTYHWLHVVFKHRPSCVEQAHPEAPIRPMVHCPSEQCCAVHGGAAHISLSGPLEGGNENSRIWSFHLDTLRVPKLVPHPSLQPGTAIVDPSNGKRRFPLVRGARIRPTGAGFLGCPGQGRRVKS